MRQGYSIKNRSYIILLVIILYITSMNAYTAIVDKSLLADKQILHRGNAAEINSLDPHSNTDYPSYIILLDIFEGLMTYAHDGHLILGQAKSYSVSKNQKTYTFKLHDNLKWSNGDPITAYDYVASFRRALDPDSGSVTYELFSEIKNADAVIKGKLSPKHISVFATDKLTLIIELEHPNPNFLNLLATPYSAPIHKYNIKNGFFPITNIITNGPFKINNWVVYSYLELEKNPYFREAHHVILNKVFFHPFEDQTTGIQQYRTDQIDYLNSISDPHLEWIQKTFGNELHIFPSNGVYFYGFNMQNTKLGQNKNLRKALAYAIDKDFIASKILKNGNVATHCLTPATWPNYHHGNYNKRCTNKLSNVERINLAKSYFAKSGYNDKNPLKLKLHYNTNESHKTIAIAIAKMWQQNLGVETELHNQEWKNFLNTVYEHKDTEVFRLGTYSLAEDPYSYLLKYTHNNVQNSIAFSNEQFDRVLMLAQSATDPEKKRLLFQKAEDIILEEAALIPLFNYTDKVLLKPRVGGFIEVKSGLDLDRYKYIIKD